MSLANQPPISPLFKKVDNGKTVWGLTDRSRLICEAKNIQIRDREREKDQKQKEKKTKKIKEEKKERKDRDKDTRLSGSKRLRDSSSQTVDLLSSPLHSPDMNSSPVGGVSIGSPAMKSSSVNSLNLSGRDILSGSGLLSSGGSGMRVSSDQGFRLHDSHEGGKKTVTIRSNQDIRELEKGSGTEEGDTTEADEDGGRENDDESGQGKTRRGRPVIKLEDERHVSVPEGDRKPVEHEMEADEEYHDDTNETMRRLTADSVTDDGGVEESQKKGRPGRKRKSTDDKIETRASRDGNANRRGKRVASRLSSSPEAIDDEEMMDIEEPVQDKSHQNDEGGEEHKGSSLLGGKDGGDSEKKGSTRAEEDVQEEEDDIEGVEREEEEEEEEEEGRKRRRKDSESSIEPGRKRRRLPSKVASEESGEETSKGDKGKAKGTPQQRKRRQSEVKRLTMGLAKGDAQAALSSSRSSSRAIAATTSASKQAGRKEGASKKKGKESSEEDEEDEDEDFEMADEEEDRSFVEGTKNHNEEGEDEDGDGLSSADETDQRKKSIVESSPRRAKNNAMAKMRSQGALKGKNDPDSDEETLAEKRNKLKSRTQGSGKKGPGRRVKAGAGKLRGVEDDHQVEEDEGEDSTDRDSRAARRNRRTRSSDNIDDSAEEESGINDGSSKKTTGSRKKTRRGDGVLGMEKDAGGNEDEDSDAEWSNVTAQLSSTAVGRDAGSRKSSLSSAGRKRKVDGGEKDSANTFKRPQSQATGRELPAAKKRKEEKDKETKKEKQKDTSESSSSLPASPAVDNSLLAVELNGIQSIIQVC